jgi:hypothetical protein
MGRLEPDVGDLVAFEADFGEWRLIRSAEYAHPAAVRVA